MRNLQYGLTIAALLALVACGGGNNAAKNATQGAQNAANGAAQGAQSAAQGASNAANGAVQGAGNAAHGAMQGAGNAVHGAMAGAGMTAVAVIPTSLHCGAVKPVWANENTKVYHEPGDPLYGRTSHGVYMCAATAVAHGFHRAAP